MPEMITALLSALAGALAAGVLAWLELVQRDRKTIAQDVWTWSMEYHCAVADLLTARATLLAAPPESGESARYLELQRRLSDETDKASKLNSFPTVYMALRTEYGEGPRWADGDLLDLFRLYLQRQDELLSVAVRASDFEPDRSSPSCNRFTLEKVIPLRERLMDDLVTRASRSRIAGDAWAGLRFRRKGK
jgi:hypothetical protein